MFYDYNDTYRAVIATLLGPDRLRMVGEAVGALDYLLADTLE